MYLEVSFMWPVLIALFLSSEVCEYENLEGCPHLTARALLYTQLMHEIFPNLISFCISKYVSGVTRYMYITSPDRCLLFAVRLWIFVR